MKRGKDRNRGRKMEVEAEDKTNTARGRKDRKIGFSHEFGWG